MEIQLGNIDASLITTFSGNASDIYNVYKSSGISGLGNEGIHINNTTVDASLLNTLDGNTTGNIDASELQPFLEMLLIFITFINLLEYWFR